MSTTKVFTPTSRVRIGYARADITPPVGIYHPCWGAARHDRSTGVHKPLFGDILTVGPIGGTGPSMLRAHLDWIGLSPDHYRDVSSALSTIGGVPAEEVLLACSHTHACGRFLPDRISFPGGELIEPYLKDSQAKLEEATRQAVENMQEVVITYAVGRCNMARNRDYWDEANGIYTCGYNPDAPSDDTLVVARATDQSGKLVATIVNYACHGTTLAWLNMLISPDFVGAMREEVERITGAPCIYAQGASGDLGPRESYSGDAAVADKNGRWLAYAALSTLESMGPPATDFEYQGPVISGATLGTWAHVPMSEERLAAAARLEGGAYTVDLPLKPKPKVEDLKQQIEDWLARQREADAKGEATAARDYGARAERARRWLGRLDSIPDGGTYPFPYSVYRVGDAIWVTTSSEPYNLLQTELRRRFPETTIMLSPLTGGSSIAYLLPADRYGKGLYQEEPSLLKAGCLETLIDTVAGRIQELL